MSGILPPPTFLAVLLVSNKSTDLCGIPQMPCGIWIASLCKWVVQRTCLQAFLQDLTASSCVCERKKKDVLSLLTSRLKGKKEKHRRRRRKKHLEKRKKKKSTGNRPGRWLRKVMIFIGNCLSKKSSFYPRGVRFMLISAHPNVDGEYIYIYICRDTFLIRKPWTEYLCLNHFKWGCIPEEVIGKLKTKKVKKGEKT